MLDLQTTYNPVHASGTRFIDEVVVNHGPAELLGNFFLDAHEACENAGVIPYLGTFDELAKLNRENSDNWVPMIPTFDPANGPLEKDKAFCIIARNSEGEGVAAHAARLFEWPHTNFADELTSYRLFYSDPAAMKLPNESCTVTSRLAHEVTGRVVYSGAAWVRPDYRGRALALVLPRLAKAYAYTLWRPQFIVSWMTESTHKKGLLKHVGYTSIDWAIELRNSFIGDLRFAFLTMREQCLLNYVSSFTSDIGHKVDTRVRQRSTQ